MSHFFVYRFLTDVDVWKVDSLLTMGMRNIRLYLSLPDDYRYFQDSKTLELEHWQ